MSQKVRRSLLFVPGSRPDRFDKAAAAGADMVCIDLEDACLSEEKDVARDNALQWIAQYSGPVETVLRVNSVRTRAGLKDILALAENPPARPLTLMLPKVDSAEDLRIVDGLLDSLDCNFIALLESTAGIEAAFDIARATARLSGLMLGGADLAAELRGELCWETMCYSRGRLAAAAGRAELDLLDVPWLDIGDDPGLREETARVKRIGFTGKAAIHPTQLAGINETFLPSSEELTRAQEILAAFTASGKGAIQLNGRLIDRPVVLAAQRTVSIATAMRDPK